MKAAQLDKYSKDFQLVVRDIQKPVPNNNEVLVKVKYAAVNPLEMLIGSGSVRVIQDYKFPLTMGNEFSGVVEAVGKNVKSFKINDAVYARMPLNKIGAFAEYLTIDQNELALMPSNLDFAHAAAVPLTGLTAYQSFHDILKTKPGQSLMIPGGSGSLGQLAIPIAKKMGLNVSVSGNSRGREDAMKMGVDQYFDYKTENYWEKMPPVDYVMDTLGPKELEHELKIIKPGGELLSLRMGPNRDFAKENDFSWWKTLLFSMVGRKLDKQASAHQANYKFIFVKSSGSELAEVTKIVEKNKIEPAIDPTLFKIDDINKALDLVANGHSKGKVLITF
jgi:NADPH:quinone reductase-like Zn-dependent oxidoreductase